MLEILVLHVLSTQNVIEPLKPMSGVFSQSGGALEKR